MENAPEGISGASYGRTVRLFDADTRLSQRSIVLIRNAACQDYLRRQSGANNDQTS